MVVYDCGIVFVQMEGGGYRQFTTDNIGNKFHVLFYDMNGEGDEVIFEDKTIQKEWRTLFVHMFSEEGAFLLYVSRNTLNVTGAQARVGNAESVPGIRREAFNVAALLLEELPEMLLLMEEIAEQKESELTLLSVGREYGR